MPKKTERLEIRAESQFIERLNSLANDSGVSKAVVIDRAIGLYAQALKEAREGNVIQFVKEEKNELAVAQ